MSWICTSCGLNNVNLNERCADKRCNNKRGEFEPFDTIDETISKDRLRKLDRLIERENMTPQEELFAQLFNHEKNLVKDMDLLTLRAHREELAKIAFEARARLTAVDDEEKSRKRSLGKAEGFERSLNVDETSSNAINTIKDRQKKLSGKEKMLEGLIQLYMKGGMGRAEAEQIASSAMGAGAILGRLKDKESKESKASADIITGRETRSPLTQENGFIIKKSTEEIEKKETPIKPALAKPIFNPFAK
jgi:hypothetical protein